MKLLIIDTSSDALYIAAMAENKDYVFYNKDLNKKHSETLLFHLNKLLSENNLKLDCLDCFCCVVGPGSFTGIRIGITTMRAFAQVYDRPVMSVNSLQLAAYNVKEKGFVISVKDAIRDKYYAAVYNGEEEIISANMYTLQELSKLKEKIIEDYGKAYIVYDGEIAGFDGIIKPPFPDYCGYCRDKMKRGLVTSYNNLTPVYGALSQAERLYENKKLDE
ncbi:MAG: tRNA (adenosine(37)-N6)-threonylcarbamoyltransferase complex dimerization subunit type 1 TsaB [Clostridia bacterium]|nr:tRNA (adenosine(37)-N6)-threonylcarbamoyltransferase complex dimerization subunit type 1 TsaB [Clostridia bacterium]